MSLTVACTQAPAASVRAIEVRLRNGIPGEQIAVLSEPESVAFVLQALQRAGKVQVGEPEWQRFSRGRCFDVIGDRPVSGRWLYEPASGTLTKLNILRQPVLRLTAEDRVRLNAFFAVDARPSAEL